VLLLQDNASLHISLICSITFELWSGAYRTFRLIHT